MKRSRKVNNFMSALADSFLFWTLTLMVASWWFPAVLFGDFGKWVLIAWGYLVLLTVLAKYQK